MHSLLNFVNYFKHEAKIKSVQESMKELDDKKRQLEATVDTLNEECTNLKTQGKTGF